MKKTFLHAINGFKTAIKTERNMRIHLILGFLAIALGFVLQISTIEWCIVSFAIGIVLAAEMINTALEYLLDHLHPEHHETIGKVKDISAGMVLILSLAAAISGVLIFAPKLLKLIN